MKDHHRLSDVMSPVNTAKGLPNEHYISPEVFEEEKQSVLFANWSGIGFGKDVPETGDVRPVEFLGMPLLIVRNHDGAITVFQNTCRHRGMILVDQAKNIQGAIRCPYHSWCYSLKGELRATPHVGGPGQNMHPDVDRASLGLFPIRSHVWQDIIFVNIDGQAADFRDCNSDLLQRWREIDRPVFHGGTESSFSFEVKTNWKLAVENYCESYHLPWVHPGLNSYSKLEDHYNISVRNSFSGQGTKVYRQLKSETGLAFPDFPALSEKWDRGAEYIAVYPNVLLGVHRDHSFAIILEPVDCANTIEHIELYYTDMIVTSPEYDQLRNENARLWKSVFQEDLFVVEGMQRGRSGVLFDGGRFSPEMDEPTHNFHYWVAQQVDQKRHRASGS